MTFVNHLSSINAQSLFHAVAYGKHVVTGNLAKSIVSGSSPTHQITIQQMLGRGPWDGIEGAWYRGLNLVPANYKFYPGILSPGMGDATQGQDSVFNTDTPHSNVSWIRAQLPTGVGDFDTKNSPPQSFTGIFRTMKCQDYDAAGDPDGAIAYSTNPALQVADLILRIGGRPASRIDWGSWCEWRDFLAGLIPYDYTILPNFDGFGLQGEYYDGTAFDTLKTTRIDPSLEFVSSSGAPSIHIASPTSFSVRWEGYIRAKYTETYTFRLTHNDGGKLWVDDLVTPLINQWGTTGTHTNTIALTAGQLYPIKIEWNNAASTSEFRLEWSSSSQAQEVIPYKALYPKTVDRPRYETHPFFTQPTRLDDAVRTILNLCNSTYQEVNGKYRFFCIEQLTENQFWFNEDNIVDGSMTVKMRDPLTVRNSWTAQFRDIDSQYLESVLNPPLIERPALIAAAGRKIDGDAIDLFTCSRHQAYRVLDWYVRRFTDPKWGVDVVGNADTFPVIGGDRVKADIDPLNLTQKDALVIEASDSSSESTADERSFALVEFIGVSTYPPVLTSLVWSGVTDLVTGSFYVNGGTGTVRILRKPGRTNEEGSFTEVATAAFDDVSFTDDPTPTGWYTYKLTQDGVTGESNVLDVFIDLSNTASISSLSFGGVTNEVTVNISNGGGSGDIHIHRRIDGGAWSERGVVSSVTTSLIDAASVSGSYEYKLTQEGIVGESAIQSISVTVTAGPPYDLAIVSEYCLGGSLWVDLEWATDGVAPGDFIVQRKKGSGSWVTVAALPSGTTTLSDEIVYLGKGAYYWRVWQVGVTGYSNQVSTRDDGSCGL